MNRRIWTGVAAGVLGAVVLLTVGVGAYRAGQRDDAVTRVVSEDSSGEVVRVVSEDHGFRPGFFLFPLLVILLVVWLVWGRGRAHGWHRPYGHGWGHGYGHEPDPGSRAGWFDEWHRRAHEAEAREGQGPQDEPPPPGAGSPSTA